MSTLLKRIRNLAWDFDGVKYSFHSVPDIYDICDRACAENAISLIDGLDFETARKLGQDSYRTYGDSVGAFIEFAREKGLDVNTLRTGLFEGYHLRLREYMEREHPHVMARDERLVQVFRALGPHIQHGMATHSHIESWARPYLNKAGLLKFFNEKALLGLDHVDFITKSTSPRMVQECLDRMDADPRESGFVEDSLRNIGHAKDIDPQLVTIYVHQGKPLDKLPSFVDHQTENNLTLMQEIAAAKSLSYKQS